LGQSVHGAGQLDRLAHAESMRGAGENILRKLVGAGVPYLYLAGGSGGGGGVDENDVVRGSPAIHQREALAGLLHDLKHDVKHDFKAGRLASERFRSERTQATGD